MLNQTEVRKETYGDTNQILFAVEHQVSIGVVVSKALGVEVGTKKIVKAGTPLAGELNAKTPNFIAVADDSSTEAPKAAGILLHDVDVTAGDANGTLLLFGFVNTNRIDEATKAKLTDKVKAALPMIKFVAY